MMTDTPTGNNKASQQFDVRVLRRDGPGQVSYWQRFRVPREPDMNVISVLQRIAAHPVTTGRRRVAPVAWDCNCLEEVCGSCTMLVNGRVRQACTALVDRLLEERPGVIELRPMTKFPVVRDLVVDRSRMFRVLERIRAWIPVDGYYDMGPGPIQSKEDQERIYPLSKCMSCGCCLEACPQFTRIEPVRAESESETDFRHRRQAAFDRGFLGAAAISQVMLFNTHPTGRLSASQRLDELMGPGGVQVCGNAQNCVKVCPKDIPLTASIGQAGRAATVQVLRWWFDR